MTPTSPRSSLLPDGLLVSVRSVVEAEEAVAGGAAIIDVKEPARGPLGRADVEVAVAIARVVAGRAGVTVACGELAAEATLATYVAAIISQFADARGARPIAVKAGPAGLALDRWRRAYERLSERLGRGVEPVELVAVAYADWRAAQAPAPATLIAAAIAAGASTILIDTFDKAAGTLLEVAGAGPIHDWVAAAHAGALRVALAGRLSAASVGLVAGLGADVVGVRSAACGGDRMGQVGRGHVARIVGTLDAVTPAGRRPPLQKSPEEVHQ